MKYKFEDRLEQNLLSMEVINARRFAHAVRDALAGLELEARCYGLKKEDYYLDTKEFLEKMATRLEAKPSRLEKELHGMLNAAEDLTDSFTSR